MNDRFFTTITVVLIACAVAFSQALIRFDHFYSDLGQQLSINNTPENVVIIAIDEASINAIGNWPWSKRFHTELIHHLTHEKPKSIGFGVDFSEPEHDAPEVDNAFAEAIARSGNVVLPVSINAPHAGATIKQNMPIPVLRSSAAGLGFLQAVIDADGVARGLYLWDTISTDTQSLVALPHFSYAILQVANLLPHTIAFNLPLAQPFKSNQVLKKLDSTPANPVSSSYRKINFFTQSAQFNQISYVDVLANKYPSGFFKDKIVLVGITADGLNDALATPLSLKSQSIPSIAFYASAVGAIQSASLVVDAPIWMVLLLSGLLAIPPLFWVTKLTSLKSILLIVIYFFLVILISLSTQYLLGVWIPVSGALVGILLVFPIWSWRKLNSAQLSLDKELQRLRDELSALGMVTEDHSVTSDFDPLQSRILKVNLTVQHLRNLHKSRNDTLAFISHDIRAPLGAAMMLLDKFETNKYSERMSKMLIRAHSMAEGFLQASRAEMANVNRFHELDIVSLTQQAIDDVYEISMAKQLKLMKDFPDEPVWVRGDFGLLLRAISNILINAVKYSPEHGVVSILLNSDRQSIVLKVTDQGPGIPAKKITKVFRRFSRAEGEHQAQEGAGLGLYFVNVTIKKHRGAVTVQSEEGHGATFIITLPIERRKEHNPVENDRRKHQVSPFNDTI